VKPEIRRSLTVAEWPREVRLTFIYLWMYLDDEGRGLDDMRLIVSELYPLDRDVTEKKMDRWLNLMATTKTSDDDVPPLCRYEVGGRRYLHAVNWDHQKINRPQKSRLPQCPIHDRLTADSVNGSRNDSVNAHGADTEPSPPSRAPADQGSGNKGSGNKGTRDQGTLAPDEPTPKQRPRDEIFDALVAACGIDPTQLTDAGRGPINNAVKQLRAIDATGPQIALRARRYRERFRDAALTPSALAKHWAALATTNGNRAERPVGFEFGMDR
jgi:hypothetical protein